jgi:hypothetical protein
MKPGHKAGYGYLLCRILSFSTMGIRTVLLMPLTISAIYCLSKIEKAQPSSYVYFTIGGTILAMTYALIFLSSLLFNDHTLQPRLPWGMRNIPLEMLSILTRLLICIMVSRYPTVTSSLQMIIALSGGICLGLAAIGFETGTVAVKIMGVSQILIIIMLPLWTVFSELAHCNLYTIAMCLPVIPFLTILIYSIKRRKVMAYISNIEQYLYKDKKHFEESFRELCDILFKQKETYSKGLLISIINNHKRKCINEKCMCKSIKCYKTTQTLSKHILISHQSSNMSMMSQGNGCVLKRSSSVNVENDMYIKDSVTAIPKMKDFSKQFAMYILIESSKNIGRMPIIYIMSSYFKMSLLKNKYLTIYDIHKAEDYSPNFLEKFYIYSIK